MKQFYSFSLCLSLAFGMATAATPTVAIMKTKAHAEVKSTKLSAVNSQRTVLSQKEMAPGIVKRLVRDKEGYVYADMIKNGVVSKGRQNIRPVTKAPGGATFYEGFEGHVDELDWLPEGWTEVNTPENKPTEEMCRHNINNSWAGQDTGDGYWTAITPDGRKECWIHFTYKWNYKNDAGEEISGEAASQDEWLITPEITVGAADDLYFLAEADLGSVYYFDWDTMTYSRDIIDTDLEVLITTDNGENWTTLWKLSDDVCSRMSDSEMYDAMAELNYYTYNVSLSDYRGKTVKIAFRYINDLSVGWGNSMAVDAVTVAAPMPEAFYQLPAGTLYAGVSDGLHAYTESYALIPAYTEISWTAESNAYTEKNSWAFYNVASEEMNDVVEGKTVSVTYPWSQGVAYPYPVLTASNGNGTDAYSFDRDDEEKGGLFVGGKVPAIADEVVYLGNYDYQHKRLVAPHFGNYVDYCFGTCSPNTWGEGIEQIGFGELFMAPAAPLTVEDVMVTLGEFEAEDDAVLTLEIYTVDDYGTVSESPVATSSVLGKDIDGWGFYNVFFRLEQPYEMTGMTLIMVKGYDDAKVKTLAACAQSMHNDAYHNSAYMMFKMPNGALSLYPASEALQDYSSALYISLNGTFHVLKLDEEIIELSEETGSVEVTASATNAPENWWIVNKDDNDARLPLVAEGTAYDWLTVTPVTKEDGSYAVRFTASATEKQRSKTVYLSNGGAEARIRVKQAATTGINSIASDKFAVSVSGDILSVNGAAEDAVVDIYSAEGYRVYSGINNVDIAGFAKGLYIVCCDGKTAKYVK